IYILIFKFNPFIVYNKLIGKARKIYSSCTP
ncbi:unnamed protein product, partial [marine sediment metagenome]